MTGIKSANQTIKDLREENEKLREKMERGQNEWDKLMLAYREITYQLERRGQRITELEKELADEQAEVVRLEATNKAGAEWAFSQMDKLEAEARSLEEALRELTMEMERPYAPSYGQVVARLQALLSTPKEKA